MFKIIMISILSSASGESQLSQGFRSMEACIAFAKIAIPAGNETVNADNHIYTRQDAGGTHRVYCIPNP